MKLLSGIITVALVTSAAAQSPPIAGLAHVAIAVHDLSASRAFYNRLGFEEAFHFGEGDAVTQSFLKVNDRQFIELYPATQKQPAGFLHLCFDGDDLDTLYTFYAARGLAPKPVRKARAGNLLFTMEGPESQNIEYTQYLPGSLHSEDHGKHLDQHRIADSLLAVALAMKDPAAARSFYIDKLAFAPIPGHPQILEIPGRSNQQILFATAGLLPHGRTYLRVSSLKDTAATLKRLDLPVTTSDGAISITDPDGNELVFQSAAVAAAQNP